MNEEEKKKKYKETFGRMIKPNEIVIEDLPEEELFKTMGRLENDGYRAEYWKAEGQDSGHVHIKDIQGLPGDLSKEQLANYKKLFIKKYVPEKFWGEVDFQLCGVHRIAEENKPHYKYGSLKKLINIGGDYE